VSLRIFSNLRQPKQLVDVVDKAAAEGALLVYTLVRAEQRDVVHDRASQHGVTAVDLMGPLMARIGMWLGESPVSTPGLLHRMDEEYFNRVEALEFAVKNDDGQLPRNFPKADMVLVGVSRTSKTPVASTLAQRGYKVANLPLVMGIKPPREIDEVDPHRVFGLTIAPEVLHDIRVWRLRYLGVKDDRGYAALDHIREELEDARAIFRAHPEWKVVDVTNRAVEETASEILGHYTRHFGDPTMRGAPSSNR
jgi:regulator of PEP synthase PpsR (kinase-PPPase family)